MKLVIIMILIFTYYGLHAATLEQEVATTSQLRQEVELLSLEVESLKKGQQSEMDIYIQRDQELTAQILKEKFRGDQIKTQIQAGKGKLQHHGKTLRSRTSEAWLKTFWGKYFTSLEKAHPLYAPKLHERIQKLKMDLEQNKISYEHALLQTWFFLDTDLSKAQEAEFILAPLQLNDKLYHVEMVRFGRTRGYFRTAEGQYGQLHFNQKWELSFFDDSTSQKMVEALLSQFKQQQKTGLYQLPGIQL
jgi:hypothetical protein